MQRRVGFGEITGVGECHDARKGYANGPAPVGQLFQRLYDKLDFSATLGYYTAVTACTVT